MTVLAAYGWPTNDNLPDTLAINAIMIEQPKAIFYLVTTPHNATPRLYELPYTKENAEQAENLQQRMKQTNQPIFLEKEDLNKNGKGKLGESPLTSKNGVNYNFKDLKDLLPKKD